MGGVADVAAGPDGDGHEGGRVEAVGTDDGLCVAGQPDAPHDRRRVGRVCGDEEDIRTGRAGAGPRVTVGRPFACLGEPLRHLALLLVGGRREHAAALSAEGALEVARESPRGAAALVVHHGCRACVQSGDGVLRARRRLRVVAATGEEEPVRDLARQSGGGRAAGDERYTCARRHGRGREHLFRIGEPDDGGTPCGDETPGGATDAARFGLCVALEQLHPTAEQAAAGVDALHRQPGAVEGRDVSGRLAAPQVIDGADPDRRGRRRGRRPAFAAGRGRRDL